MHVCIVHQHLPAPSSSGVSGRRRFVCLRVPAESGRFIPTVPFKAVHPPSTDCFRRGWRQRSSPSLAGFRGDRGGISTTRCGWAAPVPRRRRIASRVLVWLCRLITFHARCTLCRSEVDRIYGSSGAGSYSRRAADSSGRRWTNALPCGTRTYVSPLIRKAPRINPSRLMPATDGSHHR